VLVQRGKGSEQGLYYIKEDLDTNIERAALRRKYDWSGKFLLVSPTQPGLVSGAVGNHVHTSFVSETVTCSEMRGRLCLLLATSLVGKTRVTLDSLTNWPSHPANFMLILRPVYSICSSLSLTQQRTPKHMKFTPYPRHCKR
jgi:hypothetical protein